MSRRWEPHKKYGTHDEDYLYDGLIDNEDDSKYICDWDYVASLLNEYEEHIQKEEKENLKVDIKVDLSDIKGICDMIDEFHNYITELEHELNTLDGLYCSDNPKFTEPFRLDFTDVLKKEILIPTEDPNGGKRTE